MGAEWFDPKILATFMSAGVVTVGVLKKVGLLNLAWTRNSKPKAGNPAPAVHEVLMPCIAKFDQLENDRTELKTKVANHKERLDKGDAKFEKIMDGISKINENVAVLAAAERRRNGQS